jgi:hypothetical protein
MKRKALGAVDLLLNIACFVKKKKVNCTDPFPSGRVPCEF